MSVDMSQGNKNMDYAAHAQSYNLFIRLVQWGAGGTILVLVLMAYFLL